MYIPPGFTVITCELVDEEAFRSWAAGNAGIWHPASEHRHRAYMEWDFGQLQSMEAKSRAGDWLLGLLPQQAEFYQLDENGIYRTMPPGKDGRYHSAALPGLWLQSDWLRQTPLPPLLSILKAWELV